MVTFVSIIAMVVVNTLSGDKTFSLSEMCISYIYATCINIELEVETKVLRFGKSVSVSSIDIKNTIMKQITFQGHATFYHMLTSSL